MRLERRSAARDPRARRTALVASRRPHRRGTVAGVALAVGLAGVLPLALVPGASADPTPAPGGSGTSMPSQAQVDRAGQAVTAKQRGVTAIQAALTAASSRLEAASSAAEQAAESYNGAVWRLSQARTASATARAEAARAARHVARQRAGIVTLVTQSYQDGTELGTATALMSKEGPRGLMNRYGVVQSAGESMDARYAEFRTASRQARRAAAAARAAQARQAALATSAQQLAVGAAQAASSAGAVARQIAGEQQQLLRELAAAQHVSVALATRRQTALAEVARRRAAAAAAAKAAEQARLARVAEIARQRAAAAARSRAAAAAATAAATASAPRPDPGPVHVPPAPVSAPVVSRPAASPAGAVARAIAYAKAQLGKPYVWAAAGPDTFDCSGLTMQAWARGGVSLAHYTGAQYDQTTHVSMADARPGDLLFFSSNGAPSGIHHVALYLGDGQFIEAPHTGAFVRYNSIYTWYPDFVGRP